MTNIITQTPKLGKMDYVPSEGWNFDLTISFEDATYTVNEVHESNNMTTFDNIYGVTTVYTLPINTDASEFDEWMSVNAKPLLERIKAGYSTSWVSGNERAKLTEDASDAKDALLELLDSDNGVPLLSEGGQADANDYLYDARQSIIKEYGITGETSDEELRRISDLLDEQSLDEMVRLDGTFRFLRGLRTDLTENED